MAAVGRREEDLMPKPYPKVPAVDKKRGPKRPAKPTGAKEDPGALRAFLMAKERA